MPDDLDWRLHAVFSCAPEAEVDGSIDMPQSNTGIVVDAIQVCPQRVLAYPIPNATAMMLNASKKAFAEAKNLREHRALSHAPRGFVQFRSNADAVDFGECVALSAIAAHTALECFANEWIPPWLTYKQKNKKGDVQKILNKEEIERRLKLSEKLGVVLPHVFGVATPRGTAIWECFVRLESVRNRVVHMKAADRESGDVHTDTIWKALWLLPSPYQTAKQLVDLFMKDAPQVPGFSFDKLRPTRPRWHATCPPDQFD